MSLLGISAVGVYVPRLRLSRKAIAQANVWALPALQGLAHGERAICNWDEDNVTMAVEASRVAVLPAERTQISAVYLASTAFPFAERQNAGLVAAALRLPRSVSTLDIGGSQRAGTSALVAAAQMSEMSGVIVSAADHRRAKPGSRQEMQWGDAAATVVMGHDRVLARCLGVRSLAADFIDQYRGEEQLHGYDWEERWVREEGYGKLVPETVRALLERTGVAPESIAHFILPTTFPKLAATIAKRLKLPERAITDDLAARIGNAGVAHPLLMLAGVIERCRPGERILVVGFGSGCDALLFESTERVASRPRATTLEAALARGRADDNYLRFLSFNHEIELDWGKRAEIDTKTALSAQYRASDMVLGFVGGRCSASGTVEFPRSRISVNPEGRHVDTQEDYPLADEPASIMSFTTDWLSFKESPPFQYGQVQFDCGARLIMEFTDADAGQLEVGTPLRMAFRVKDYDLRRGFRRYFWKAVPQSSWLGEE